MGWVFLLLAAPTYVGVATCAKCHDTSVWAQSRHSKMVQPATGKAVVGDFARARVLLHGKVYLLEHTQAGYFITESYVTGKPLRHRVEYTLGNRRIQHYLTTMPDGSIILLPPTWDLVRKQWFHNLDIVDPEEDPGARVQLWNKQCYSCHVSQEQKNFDGEKVQYKTNWIDFGVNCERCHGPGSEHVERYSGSAPADAPSKIVVQTRLDPARNTAVCAQCHSFRDIWVDGFTAGSNYFDHFRPALEYTQPEKDDPSYYKDGRMRRFSSDAFGLWQSECYLQGGLTCVKCHVTPHNTNVDQSPQLRPSNHQLCTGCHAGIAKDVPAHTHHAATSAGSSCVECHMPRTVYSIKAEIRDHSISIPVPENTIAHNIPNACNLCHKKESPAWAVQQMNQWYGGVSRRGKYIRRAAAFSSARRGDPAALPRLVSILEDSAEGPFPRANAAGYLGGYSDDPRAFFALRRALEDPEPMVRMEAALRLRPGTISPQAIAAALRPLLRDPVNTVRMSAAVGLLNLGIRDLPGEDAALNLFKGRAQLNSDDAEQQLATGRLSLLAGDFPAAIAAFQASLKLEPGRIAEARRVLEAIPAADPQYVEARRLLQALPMASKTPRP